LIPTVAYVTWAQQAAARSPVVTTVRIPSGFHDAELEKTFEPQIVKVVIGVNNTVMWVNDDDVASFIEANSGRVDPAFYAATEIPERQNFVFSSHQTYWIRANRRNIHSQNRE
jgi:hypothetical protein